MKLPRPSTVLLGVALPVLILLTVLAWQFRFQESGRVYFADSSLSPWAEEETFGKGMPPRMIDNKTLRFIPNELARSGTRRSWRAEDSHIKVRIKHRAPEPLKEISPEKKYPVLIQLAGYEKIGAPYLEGPAILAFSSPSSDWETTEAVIALPEGTGVFTLYLSTLSENGVYEVSDIRITGVQERPYYTFSAAILVLLWGLWIYHAIRYLGGAWTNKPTTLWVATVWILLWMGIVVFPRPIDIPRPFSETFQTGSSSIHRTGERMTPEETPTREQTSKKQAVKKHRTTNWQSSLSKIKTHPAGRFLIHFGVMTLFGGVLLYMIPLKTGLPFILFTMLGGEVVPYLWLGNFDLSDQLDLVAYAASLVVVIP
ncbi:MAG: hypothetical protein ACON38_20240, partial [Akkermansiaceae bacterium]